MNLPHNAGAVASISGQGTKILHAVEQLLRLGFVSGVSVHCNKRSHVTQWSFHIPQIRPDAAKKKKKKVRICLRNQLINFSKNISCHFHGLYRCVWGKLTPEQYLLIRHDWRICVWYVSIFLGFLQVLPLFSHTNLCMPSFIKCTIMFHKGQGSLCVWIQLGKGIPGREVMKPEKMQAGPHRS